MSMNNPRKNKTLSQFNFWFYFFVFLLLFSGFGEFISRLNSDYPPTPYAGIAYPSANKQLLQFEKYTELFQAPDCIFFGSSLVQTGIDPSTFEIAFKQMSKRSIRCYNFGMDASTMSSTAPVAMIIAQKYKPQYLIIGVQGGQFLPHKDIRHRSEDQFQDDSWVRYSLGYFNLQGWLFAHSALYFSLNQIATWMFPEQSISPESVEANPTESNATPIHPEVPRIINDKGFGPLSGYRDSSPVFNFTNSPSKNADEDTAVNLDAADFSALRQIIQFAQRNNFILVLVEMPIYNPSSLTQRILDQVKTYARENDTPFLSTEGLSQLPHTAYSDQSHMHISGSMMFTQWLGTQLGEAEVTKAFSDVNSPIWTPVLKTWPQPIFLGKLGMNDDSYSDYKLSLEAFNLIPHDSKIFNPSNEKIDQQFLQSLIGFEIDWKDGITPQDRENLFQLITILGKMRYEDDLLLSPDHKTELDQWRTTLKPSILSNLGMHYIVCRIELASPQKYHCPDGIMSNPDYKLIKSWDFDPLYERYSLMQIIK